MDFNDILDDNEKQALIAFNSSDTMKQAVKKVLLAGIYENGTLKSGIQVEPSRNAAFWLISNVPTASDTELGQELRGVWQGITALETAFKKISEFIPPKADEPDKINEAR